MSGRDPQQPDPELEALVGRDPALLDTAKEVRSALRGAEIDPGFERRLRERVVRQRELVLAARARRQRRWPALGVGAAAVLALGLVVLALLVLAR